MPTLGLLSALGLLLADNPFYSEKFAAAFGLGALINEALACRQDLDRAKQHRGLPGVAPATPQRQQCC